VNKDDHNMESNSRPPAFEMNGTVIGCISQLAALFCICSWKSWRKRSHRLTIQTCSPEKSLLFESTSLKQGFRLLRLLLLTIFRNLVDMYR